MRRRTSRPSTTSPDPFGLVRVDLVGSGADKSAGSVTAGAARTAAPERQGGASKRLVRVVPGGGGRAEVRPHTRQINFQLSRQELVDLLPPARGHAMD